MISNFNMQSEQIKAVSLVEYIGTGIQFDYK